ncbi:MAG: 16S rRNA (cytidine(1402)-2'-O)-methyltransferase [Bacteroidota bacterium]
MGVLHIVPTPIGNLTDITLRAIETLKRVDVVLAEDTRTSKTLLQKYDISTPLWSFHAHNEHKKVDEILRKLKEGTTFAQISDAGMPGVSDPGHLLIREAIKNEINLEVLPGPSAFLVALLKSGFPTDRFIYEGFLPHKKGRKSRIEAWKEESKTVVIYESPHRLLKLLEQCKEILGDSREISVSRELTKKFEETITGSLSNVLHLFRQKSIKGEFVIVINGNK